MISFIGSSTRTPAERKVDQLAAEARSIRASVTPTKEQLARLQAIEKTELPKAWRAVHQVRGFS
jgi:hypothetical protein